MEGGEIERGKAFIIMNNGRWRKQTNVKHTHKLAKTKQATQGCGEEKKTAQLV